VIKKYLISVILLLINQQIWCLEPSARILSPYNDIVGQEDKDWSKSSDFGIIYFESDYPIEELRFHRIEPSEKVDKFEWRFDSITLPKGSYDIKSKAQSKYFLPIDTMIVVEGQKSKIITLNLKLKNSKLLNYKTWRNFRRNSTFYNSIVMSYYIIPFILSPNAYSKEYRTKYFRFMALTIAINEMINYYYYEEVGKYDSKRKEYLDNKSSLKKFHKSDTHKKAMEHLNRQMSRAYDVAPIPLTPIKAIYPKLAQEAGIHGTVVIRTYINKLGKANDFEVLDGIANTGMNEASIEAIRKTKFKPAQKDKKPIGAWIEIPVNFRLKENY